jgi:IrrE N-terminal-like domain
MAISQMKTPVLIAEKIVKDEKLELPIDLLSLAKKHDILVEAKPETAKGVSGMLIKVGNSFAIGYATHIKNNGFQRFSMAHELGHFFLPGHPEYVFSGGKLIHESHAGFVSGDKIELEADHFAAGLLMPSHLFKLEVAKHSDGFTAIENVANRCETSLTASAIRYAELTDAAVAVVMSTGETVNYCFPSQSMKAFLGSKRLGKGSILPKDSLTRKFNQVENNVLSAKRQDDEADLMSWFHLDHEIEAVEEVIGLGEYGKTLTIITADLPEQDDDDERENDHSPRFR